MASLVADYSSDSEGEDDSSPQKNTVSDTDIQIKKEIKEEITAVPETPSNFFNTFEDESDDDEDNAAEGKRTSLKVKEVLNSTSSTSKLPSFSEANPGVIGSSVFVNPFERAEQAKNKILEKHVRLTEAAPQKPAHQPVCWKFKKGKCHLGKNCRFFHAVDNLSIVEDNSDISNKNNPSANSYNTTQPSPYHPAAYADARRRPLEMEPTDDDSYMGSMKKKKRVGVNDRLVPPKKAFDALMELRKKERPWTMPGAPS